MLAYVATKSARPVAALPFMFLAVALAAACSNEDIGRPPAACGNGVLEASEECEGFDTRGATCDSLGFGVGQLRCSAQCKLDTSACGVCGDGILQKGEACDGANLNGATCASLFGAGTEGTVSCSADCRSLLTETCRGAITPGALQACTPGSSTCPSPTSCVTTATGSFCIEACVLGSATCGAGRYCEDVGGAGACASVPAAGDACTTRSGCKEAAQTCVPTFTSAKGTVSTCAVACAAVDVGTGQSTCGAGASCVAVAGGPLELAAATTACTLPTEAADCAVAQGYRCRTVSLAGGGTGNRCARPYGQCAPVTPLYRFDGSPVQDPQLCDRTQATRGAGKCGLVSPTPLANPARVECIEHFSGLPDIGVCIAFCDAAVVGSGSVPLDGVCGVGAACAVPLVPEHFLAQSDNRVACTAADKSACAVQFDRCLDLGRGLECARAVRICVPN